MDSGNSGSMQSSSGGDEEYDSRGHESISAFLNSSSGNLGPLSNHPPPPPLPPSHYHNQNPSPFFDPISNYLDTFPRSPPPHNPNSLLNLDMVWPRGLRSDPNCTDLGGSGGLMGSTSSSPPIPGRGGGPYTAPSIPPPPSSDQSAGTRNSKKRSRASRRAPTTVLTTDTSNFRAMVQEFTGIPAPPFSASPFPRNRLDLFSSSSTMPPPYLLRPFAQKPSFSSLPIGSSSSSSPLVTSSMADVLGSTISPTTTTTTNNNNNNATNATNTTNPTSNTNYQLPSTDLGLLKQNLLSMNNPNFTFQSILQSPPPLPPNQSKYQLSNFPAFTAKSQEQLTANTDPHLKMGVLDGFGMNHSALPTEGMSSRSDNSPSWRHGLGLDVGDQGGHSRPFNGNYGNSPRGSSCKINYSASSSDFNAEKGSENVSSRGEGMVDSWICSSE